MREVIFNIKSAKVINTLKSSFKKVDDNNENLNNKVDMENLIHINHISNMLHVLLGARPVSSKHNSFNRKRSEYIDNIVKNGIIKYDNVTKIDYINKTKNKTGVIYNSEFTQGNKHQKNSDRDVSRKSSNSVIIKGYISWSMLKKRKLNNENYKILYNTLLDFGNYIGCSNVTSQYDIIDLLLILKNYDEWVNKLKQIKNISPILHIFNNTQNTRKFNNISGVNYATLSNLNAVTHKLSIDATVILYMEDDDVKNLLSNKKICTFLDGGFVQLKNNPSALSDFNHYSNDIISDIKNEYLNNGFININNLTYTQKYEN